MRLGPFVAGAFGIVGFVLSTAAGLVADNGFEGILLKAMLSAVVCYVIGYLVGLIGEQVSREHAAAICKKVAESEAAIEKAKQDKQAADAAEVASANAASVAAAPAQV